MIYLVSYSCCTKYDRWIIFHLIGSFSKFFDIDVRAVSDELCRTKGNLSIKNLVCQRQKYYGNGKVSFPRVARFIRNACISSFFNRFYLKPQWIILIRNRETTSVIVINEKRKKKKKNRARSSLQSSKYLEQRPKWDVD